MATRSVGSLQSVLRYPVKSMAGEALTAARVDPGRGVQGDRAFAVLDAATGRVASAKHPRRWGMLLDCRARFVEPLVAGRRGGPVAITLPDGTTVRSDGGDADALLTRALGRAVRLVDTPPPQARHDEAIPGVDDGAGAPLAIGSGRGTFFDFAPIHLVTTASLRQLQALRPASCFAVTRFRPNFVIDTGAAGGFVEGDWLGQVVAIGDEVQVCVTFPCPRCVMTTLAQDGLPADPEVLRTAAAHNLQMFALLARRLPTVGAYATVVRGGVVRLGDPVRLVGPAPLRRAAAFAHAIKRAVRRR